MAIINRDMEAMEPRRETAKIITTMATVAPITRTTTTMAESRAFEMKKRTSIYRLNWILSQNIIKTHILIYFIYDSSIISMQYYLYLQF